MEYVLNWMVLILSLGGIAIVALVCCMDLQRGGARQIETVPPPVEAPVRTAEPAQAGSSGPFVELFYRKGDAVEHVQRVYADRPEYIGTESYPMGAGMPVRYVEVAAGNGGFLFTNLDWQSSVHSRNEDGTEVDAPTGQAMPIADGTQILLAGDWTVECRLREEGQ